MPEKKVFHKKHLILMILAAAVIFCLWYTWPRSWSDLTGEYGTVQFAKASVSIYEYDDTWDHHMSRYYVLDTEGDAAVTEELLALLEDNSYRPMLRNLLSLNSLSGGDESGSEIWAATLSVNLAYGDTVLHLSVMGDRLGFSGLSFNGIRGYIIQDTALSDALAQFIMEHGVLDSEDHMSF